MNIEPDIFDYLETTSLEPHDDYTSEFTYAEQKQIWNRIKEQKQQIDQLTNNWNELEEYIENEWKVVAKSPDGSFYDGYDTCIEEMKKDILDKMKEIKEGNKMKSLVLKGRISEVITILKELEKRYCND